MSSATVIEEAIERLKIEKIEAEETYFEKGQLHGYIWCLDASYWEILSMLPWHGEGFPENPIIVDIVESIVQGDSLLGYMDAVWVAIGPFNPKPGSLFNPVAKNYFTGFVEGVQEFWDEIRDEVEFNPPDSLR